MVTICGLMDGWDIPRCRTLATLEATQFWGKWAAHVLYATEDAPFTVGQYRVWTLPYILVPL